ncbi:MAG: GNAT family N-acetyltransferase [Chloroflexia bacterium]
MFSLDLGDGLALRQLEEPDAKEMYALINANRDHLRQWMGWLDQESSVADAATFIASRRSAWAEDGTVTAGVWFEGRLVGIISYNYLDRVNRSTEIGYWLAADAQGRGLMTRSARGLVAHAFREDGLHRVEILCAPGNTRSRAIPERLGFRQDGVLREAEWLYDHFVDLVIYSMLEADWPA